MASYSPEALSSLTVSRGTHTCWAIIEYHITATDYRWLSLPVEKGRSAGSTNASASCTGQAQPPSEHAHAASHRAGRFGPLADLHGPGTAAQGPQNTHTRHRTEQAAKATQRVPTRVPSTGTHGLPAALHSACCSFQSWLFMPFAPVGLLLSLLQPARLLSAHAISSSCRVMLPHCHVTLASP